MASIEEKVEELIQNQVKELGYELYDVQYVKEGKDYFLRIFIDKPEGIDLNDCEKVSNEINPIIDKANYLKEAYFLEVSSPGVERILRKDKHLQQNIGKEIEIKLFKPIENEKTQEGFLKQYNEETVTIETNHVEKTIDRKNIALMKLKYHFE